MYTQEQKERYEQVIQAFTRHKPDSPNALLAQWQENKADLYNLLGGLKVEKELVVTPSREDVVAVVDQYIRDFNPLFPSPVFQALRKVINPSDYGYEGDYTDIPKNTSNFTQEQATEMGLQRYNKGQKLGAVLKSLLPDSGTYVLRGKERGIRDAFDLVWSEIVQKFKATGKVVLSIDPIDYLTMSYNQNDWQSCHRIGGMYQGGVLSYMADKVSMVAYAYNGKEVAYLHNGKEFKWNSKQWRQMVYIDIPSQTAIFSREYPTENPVLNKEVRKMVQALFRKINGKPIQWMVTKQQNNLHETYEGGRGSTHYHDVQSGWQYRGQSGNHYGVRMRPALQEPAKIHVGTSPKCPICGVNNVSNGGSFLCSDCRNRCSCPNCGQSTSENRLVYIRREDGSRVRMCPHCLQQSGARQCRDCHEWHMPESMSTTLDGVCKKCRNANYRICKTCRVIHRRSQTYQYNGANYCRTCYGEALNQARRA
ncbi:hypothetical protein [Anaeroselena agilis]|uniref:Uncharacterized protein n=1 Tax=Anaeroselena agilis TaxID=3063788 RepID=A0ABU3NXH1_9FIRM|nr:hypothetical protein [Selenomonadales bacterium 4137-cl]